MRNSPNQEITSELLFQAIEDFWNIIKNNEELNVPTRLQFQQTELCKKKADEIWKIFYDKFIKSFESRCKNRIEETFKNTGMEIVKHMIES